MKRKEIPEKCRGCYHMRAWSIHMDGDHEYGCRKLPVSMVGDPNCDMYEEIKQEGREPEGKE